jgi:hypothetical protein
MAADDELRMHLHTLTQLALMGDNTSAIEWLFPTGRRVDRNLLSRAGVQQVARHLLLAMLVLDSNHRLASQHLKGEKQHRGRPPEDMAIRWRPTRRTHE